MYEGKTNKEAPHTKRPFLFLAMRYLVSFGTARTTLSSTATVGVKTVALLPPASAICFPKPAIAGPAGFAGSPEVPAYGSEMRVVAGVQLSAPRQVSRTKTWRSPLLCAATTFA